jgi:hypothetical protein
MFGVSVRAAGCAALALAAGCAGSSSTVGPPTFVTNARQVTVARSGAVSPIPAGMTPSQLRVRSMRFGNARQARARKYVFVSQFSGTPVQGYHLNNKKNGPPVCSLPGQSVNGIATDRAGDLWVPSGTGGGQGYTQEYAPNCGAAMQKITDPNGQPADVGFDSKHNVYILNIFDASGHPGSVNVYNAHGSLIRSLTDPSFSELIGIATDNHDNVFVSNRDSQGKATVLEFARGKMPGTLLSAITPGLPGAPQLDRANNLIITDWQAYTLNVYAPPYTQAPTVTPMHGLSLWCPLNHREDRLYCADLGGSVDVYKYPGGTYLYSFTNGLSPSGFATGSAIQPAAPL